MFFVVDHCAHCAYIYIISNRAAPHRTGQQTMQTLNIRQEADRNAITAQGFTWVTVQPRGDNKGLVLSRHKSYDAANKAARGLDRQILEVSQAWTY